MAGKYSLLLFVCVTLQLMHVWSDPAQCSTFNWCFGFFCLNIIIKSQWSYTLSSWLTFSLDTVEVSKQKSMYIWNRELKNCGVFTAEQFIYNPHYFFFISETWFWSPWLKSVSLSLSSCLLKSGLGEYKCSLCYRYPCRCQCWILACFYSFSLHLSSKPLQLGWFLFFLKYIGLECLSLPALMTQNDYFVKEKATKCRKPSKHTKLLPDTSRLGSRVWNVRRGVHLTP